MILVASLLACTTDGDTATAPVESPAELVARLDAPGPWQVGHVERSVPWDRMITATESRELRVAVWYPTDATSGDAVSYFFGSIAADQVWGEAPAADGPFPVAVFSHGHQAYAESSSFLCEHLASHGFVVVAPDHLNNTTLDGGDRTTEIYWQRPWDLTEVLDDVLDADGTDLLAGVASDRVVGLGHSFGGYTVHAWGGATYDRDGVVQDCLDGTDTSAFCSTMDPDQALFFEGDLLVDPRVDGLISMAPGDHRLFGAGLADVGPPVLLMTGGLDTQVGDDADPIWNDLAGPGDVRVHLPTGGHTMYTDFSGALDPAGVIDAEEGWRITRVYAVAAALAWGSDDPTVERVLDGSAQVSDLAEHTSR